MAKKKDAVKVICLYHVNVECICIEPIIDTEGLVMRLKNQITIWRIRWKFMSKDEQDEILPLAKTLKFRLEKLNV